MRALVDDAVTEFDLNPKPVSLFLFILIFEKQCFVRLLTKIDICASAYAALASGKKIDILQCTFSVRILGALLLPPRYLQKRRQPFRFHLELLDWQCLREP